MKELSLHILDIAQNSVNARATTIDIRIKDRVQENTLLIQVEDNGKGMSKEMLERVNDPFFTTGNKKTGLGIPLLRQHAEAAGGEVTIHSKENTGTRIKANFIADHIDLQPMGDLAGTIAGLIRSFPEIRWIFYYETSRGEFKLDTHQVKDQLDDVPLSTPEVIRFLKTMIIENTQALSG